jgi:hypothetical protein
MFFQISRQCTKKIICLVAKIFVVPFATQACDLFFYISTKFGYRCGIYVQYEQNLGFLSSRIIL